MLKNVHFPPFFHIFFFIFMITSSQTCLIFITEKEEEEIYIYIYMLDIIFIIFVGNCSNFNLWICIGSDQPPKYDT